ncbi:MAG: hypothetical protein MUO31_11310 [Thermodesulfovibrionales bacterium]|nr:hypothetical protein [Thermodesulfovibrionales bacterium]
MKDKNSYLNLFLLFFSAFILVYFIPSSFNKILFPLYCVLFFRSKSNALWIVFIIILIELPGGLFSGGLREDMVRLPIYPLAAGVSISFEQLLIFTGIMKVFKNKLKYKPLGFLSKNIKLIALYFIFLLFLSFFMGISFYGFRNLFKILVNLTLFYSVYFLFAEESEFVDFFKLVFPLAFVAFLLQLYDLIFGHQLIKLFRPGVVSTQGVLGMGEFDRPIEMVHVLLFTFFGSLYYLILKKELFNKNYLLIVNLISYCSIFITATRTWFIAFTFTYFLLLLFKPGKMIKLILKNSILLIVAVLSLFSLSILKNQFSHAYQRIKSIELIVQGDVTAGGTLQRFDKRAPKIMKAFAKSSILVGAGFTDNYWENSDQHIGFHNFLFNGGIIGVMFPLYLVINIFYFTIKVGKKIGNQNPYKNALIIFILWMVGLLILNSSTQFIGYDVPLVRILIFSFYIYFYNNQMKAAMNFNKYRTR